MPTKKPSPKSAAPKPKSPTSPKPGDPKPKPSTARVNKPGRSSTATPPTGKPGKVTRAEPQSIFNPDENNYEPYRPPVKTSTVRTRNPSKQDKPRGRKQDMGNKLQRSVARTSGQTRGNGGLVGGPNKNDAPKPKPGRTVPRPRSTPGYYL